MSFAATFKALSDPVRREILQLLKNGKMSAGEIGSHFDMTGAIKKSGSGMGGKGKKLCVL